MKKQELKSTNERNEIAIKIKDKKLIIITIFIISTIILFTLLFFVFNNKATATTAESENNLANEETSNLNNILINEINSNMENTITENNTINEQETQEPKNETKVTNNKTTQTKNTAKTGSTPYYIKVNCGAQVVTIYKKDDSGYYTVPFKAMLCSTGTATPTSGVYEIPGRWNWGGLEGDVYGQYITVITGNILFHSVPYLERGNPGSLEYWEYDKLGTPASAGCVRLTVADALWIHTNCENGTQVEFYSSSNPGPLGKPTAKKVSDAKGNLKNWDPTDPDSSNPWKNPQVEENKNTNETIKNNTTQSTITNSVVENNQNIVENTTSKNTLNNVNTVTQNTVENKNTINSTSQNTIKDKDTTNSTSQNTLKSKNNVNSI